MAIGIDLGMPTGILAELAGDVSTQNTKMAAVLLAEDGGTRVEGDEIMDVPMLMKMDLLPIMAGAPPYSYFEEPSPGTVIQNVEGLFTENPLINPEAELIREITAEELLAMNMDDMVLERKVVKLMVHAQNIREFRVINGHERGTLPRALKGENPGNLITAD